MYQQNGRMHTLAATRSRLVLPTMINRIRRVVRDEVSCGDCLELQSIRFDVQIVRPAHFDLQTARRHLKVVQRSLGNMLKGENMLADNFMFLLSSIID